MYRIVFNFYKRALKNLYFIFNVVKNFHTVNINYFIKVEYWLNMQFWMHIRRVFNKICIGINRQYQLTILYCEHEYYDSIPTLTV